MSGIAVIVRYALRESLRRRVFLIVLLLTGAFLGLYGLGTWRAFRDSRAFVGGANPGNLDPDALAGATLLGLAMFATLFLAVVLAVFLTLGAIGGDAERGLLQPLVVRPIGRTQFLLARFLGAAAVCAVYVVVVFGATVLITGAAGDWWPDRLATPAFELAAAVVLVVGLSLLGSIFLSATANGIAVFMLFGGGLVAGLLGQIGRSLGSQTLKDIGTWSSWALPFEALYQDALHAITADTVGFTKFALELGPFGGAQIGGWGLRGWALAYLALVGLLGVVVFERRDL